ncbi:hypothetical protein OAH18_02665 [bacterium]|nr:hypothetical protein [bacterium]
MSSSQPPGGEPTSIPVSDSPIDDLRPEDLPPVEPPSAGFIVQLFVVPALIVMAVVGVWALFGRMAGGEQDYRTLTKELASTNEHRRWRAALGLAQMMKSDLDRGKDGQGLSKNRDVATQLTTMLDERLKGLLPSDDDKREAAVKHQEFLARTLGLLDVNDLTLPVLQSAMDEDHDREVRKNAIASIAMIAGRNETAGTPMESQEIADSLLVATTDADVLIRQMGTYALGLIRTDGAKASLDGLLKNSDQNTRYNAAIGLVRHGSSEGLPIFLDVLTEANKPVDADASDDMTAEQRAEYDQRKDFLEPVMLLNTMKAIGDLQEVLTSKETDDLTKLLKPIADSYTNSEVRVHAQKVLSELTK